MCIVLATTAHPSYALIIIDNRDEFILRPTSRPHWWTSHHQSILSARDLQRAEQGTWLGITKTGNFAVLTNFRETNTHDTAHPVQGMKSRGGMVTAWLTSKGESTEQFVHQLLEGEGVKGVGGFSLVCGKLRKQKGKEPQLEPLAIISNRAGTPDDVPWIGAQRGEVYGLSNTSYDDPITWPKVSMGKEKILQVVQEAVETGISEEELVNKLYGILDTDTLPKQAPDQDFEDYIFQLRHSIFIPMIGHANPLQNIPKADAIASAIPETLTNGNGSSSEAELKQEEAPDPETSNGTSGLYGTQRQTIILVDWEGNVMFRERSLYDEKGRPIARREGDMTFEFQIEGWEGTECKEKNDVFERERAIS